MAELARVLRENRVIEPRLTGGFVYGALPATTRGAESNTIDRDYHVLAATVAIQERAEKDHSPEAQGALGVAHLIHGRLDEAIDVLEGASRAAPSNSEILSDLAAAYYVRAVRENRPDQLPPALEAAERALAVDPGSVEGHFNRALVLERLSLTEAAREAWREYLRHDGTSGWAGEARRHLVALGFHKSSHLQEQRHAIAEAALTDDPAHLLQVLRAGPLAAREVVEVDLLPAWAATQLAGEPGAETVEALQRLGEAFLAAQGDAMFRDAVAVASGSVLRTRQELDLVARGHAAFARARIHYDDEEWGPARAQFQQAQDLLRQGGSPAAYWATYYLAALRYQSQDARERDQALASVDALTQYARRRRYPILLGRALGLRGLIRAVRGDYSRALLDYRAALASFEGAEVVEYAAPMLASIAETLDFLGRPDEAWRARQRSLSLLEFVENPASHWKILAGAAVAADQQDLPWTSLRLCDAWVADAEAWGRPASMTQAYLCRAQLQAQPGRGQDVAREFERAIGAAGKISNEAFKQRLRIELLVAQGRVLAKERPRAAEAALEQAITYFKESGQRARLTPLYLALARVYVAEGETAAAEADLRAGIETFETQRREVLPGMRPAFFDQAGELFDEMILLHLSGGRPEAALEFLERNRGRQLLDDQRAFLKTGSHLEAAQRQGLSWIRGQLSPGVALVYYALLDRSLVWVVTREGVKFHELAVPPSVVEGDVWSLRSALERRRSGPQIDGPSGRLWDALIEPVKSDFPPQGRLVFIPDGSLQTIPFAALRDPRSGRFLVEAHVVGSAPSAASFIKASSRSFVGAPRSALVVGNPSLGHADAQLQSLPEAEAEAFEIGRLYPEGWVLTAGAATGARFKSLAPSADLLHLGMHAVFNAAVPSRTRLLMAPDSAGGETGSLLLQDLPPGLLAHARLVVLAGCRTGSGQVYRREGALGLAYAFLRAGSPVVIASLWDLDDRVGRELSVRFHGAYLRGADPLDALRNAQLSLLNSDDPVLRAPSAWASFIAIGGAPALRPSRGQSNVNQY